MKRALTILFLFLTLFAVSQVADVKDLRIANNVTQFGANISIGGKVYDVNAQELYIATAPVVSTATLTSAAASFKKITGDFIQNQNASAQVADFWIDGSGVINDNFTKKVAGTYPTDYVVTDFPITQSAECIVILGEWKAGTYTTDAPYYVSGDFYFHNSAANYGKNGVFKVVYNNGFSSTYQHAQSNYIGQRYNNYPPYLVTFDYNGKTWMGIDLPASGSAHGFTTGVFSGRKTSNVVFAVVEATAVTNKNAYIITDGTTANIVNSNLVIGGGAVSSNNVQLTQKTTSTQETAGLGTELLTAANWTSTDWTGDFASGFTHTTGNITPLSNSYTGSIANIFKISVTITGRTAGSVNILFGGVPYDGVSSTTSYSPRCTTTGNLSITPTTDFNGTVIVSLKSVISTIPSIHSVLNSSLIATNESRASLSGAFNMYDGINAGKYTTTGTSNTGYGYNSMAYITSGSGNTAFGAGALSTNSVGNYNTAVGTNTLLNNIYGAYNVGVGYATLQANTSGSQNIGIGRSALNNNSTGSNNIALGGRNTLYSNTTGGSNLGIGYYSLFSNQAGNYNTGINTNSLYYLNGGSYNIGIGSYALERLTDGNYNVGLGAEAGRYIGASGTTPNTSSDYSVFIGSGTRALADNDQNSIVLGHAAVGLGSNSAMIGGAAVTKFGIGGTEVFYQPLKTGSAGTLGNLLVSQGTTTAPAWVPPANIGLIGSVGLSATIIPVFNGSSFVNSNLRQNTYSTGSIRIHTNDVGGILGVGTDGGGFSGSIGSKYTAGDYATYFGYDMYWQHDSAEWKANRTNMGNKILYKMTGNTGLAEWYYYNGGGAGSLTTGWQTSDMSRAMSLNAISGKLTVRGQLQSEVATGTSPLDIASTTLVPNLNSTYLGGLTSQQHLPVTLYGASNGVLIVTDIAAASNEMFRLEVEANGYGGKRYTINTQGYFYGGASLITNYRGYAVNYTDTVYYFENNGFLNIWFEQYTSSNSNLISAYVTATSISGQRASNNRITSIVNSTKPVTRTREVFFVPTQIYNAENSNINTVDWTTKNLSVNGTATGTQDATLSNQFVRYGQISSTLANGVDNGGINLTQNYIPKASDANTLTNSNIYDNGTNVGIGTTAPTSKISFGNSAGSANTTSTKMSVYDNGSQYYGIGLAYNGSLYGLGLYAYDTGTGTPKVFLGSNGTLGVGTTTPVARVDIVVPDNTAQVEQFTMRMATNPYGKYSFNQKTDAGFANQYLSLDVVDYTGTFTNNMVWSRGKVGIGTNNPLTKLQVKGGGIMLDYNNSLMFLDASATARNILTYSAADNITLLGVSSTDIYIGNSNSIVSKADGKVGINTTDPTQVLDVNGNARFRSVGTTAATNFVGFTVDGTLTTNVTIDTTDITGLLDFVENHSTQSGMVYPSAGIAVSTGTAWGTSITDNSANWNTAFGWGNHASAGYLTQSTFNSGNADLAAIEALAGTTGLLRKTAANTWTLDNSTYLTSYTETDPVWSAAATNYYTKTNVQTSGQASIHWDNITNEPTFLTSYTETDPDYNADFSSVTSGFFPAKTLFGTYTNSELRAGTNEVYVNMTSGDYGAYTFQTLGTGYFTGQVYSRENATTDSSLVRLVQLSSYANKNLANTFLDDQTIQSSAPYLYLRSTSAAGSSNITFNDESGLSQFTIQYDNGNDRILLLSNNNYISTRIGAIEVMNLATTGQLTLPQYTGTTFDGTAVKALGIDANQKLVTYTASGGGTTTNALTMNDGGAGVTSGTTFDGSVARTLSYNTLGAAGLAASNTFTGANQTIAAAGANLKINSTSGNPNLRMELNGTFIGGLYPQSDGRFDLYSGSSSYVNFASPMKLYTATSNPTAVEGGIYYNTSTDALYTSNGTTWVAAGGGGDGNTTYTQSAVTTTGGALLRLTGSDASTDDVKFASGGITTVSYTDANTITINTTAPADGKITNVTFSSPTLTFTGTNGAFNSTVTGIVGTSYPDLNIATATGSFGSSTTSLNSNIGTNYYYSGTALANCTATINDIDANGNLSTKGTLVVFHNSADSDSFTLTVYGNTDGSGNDTLAKTTNGSGTITLTSTVSGYHIIRWEYINGLFLALYEGFVK